MSMITKAQLLAALGNPHPETLRRWKIQGKVPPHDFGSQKAPLWRESTLLAAGIEVAPAAGQASQQSPATSAA